MHLHKDTQANITNKYKVIPTKALLLLKMFLYYKTLIDHVSSTIGITFMDTFKKLKLHIQNGNILL
jgi:hypothetical protein